MTEPTHLRLANGWTVSIAPQIGSGGSYAFMVAAWPTGDDELRQTAEDAGRRVPAARWHNFQGGNVEWVFEIRNILSLLREAAALEPPR